MICRRGRGRGARGRHTQSAETRPDPRAASHTAAGERSSARGAPRKPRRSNFNKRTPKQRGFARQPARRPAGREKRGGSFGGIVGFELEDVRSRQNEKYDDNNVCGGMIIIPSYATCICVSTPPESSDGNTDCPPGCDEE